MSVLEQRVFRTVTGAHVADGHIDADVLAYAAGDDVPDEIVAELGDTVTLAPVPEPEPDPEAEPVAPPRGSRIRVFRTEDGRHVHDGHRDAAFLAYTEEDDVPDEVLDELDAPAPELEPEEKAAAPSPNKSRRPAGNKSA